jgi:hypothetical protein
VTIYDFWGKKAIMNMENNKMMKMKKKRSSGYTKALNFLDLELKRSEVQEDIKQLRKRFEIPEYGFTSSSRQFTSIDHDHIPTEWSHLPIDEAQARLDKLSHAANQLLHRLGQSQRLILPSPIVDVIFYNRFGVLQSDAVKLGLVSALDVFGPNVCTFYDAKETRMNYKRASSVDKKARSERLDQIDKEFPIAIRVSPYASLRDILDYIQHGWVFIQSAQAEYQEPKTKFGKLRTRDLYLVERDDFIFNFKGTRNEMVEEFQKRFPGKDWPDEGAVKAIRHRKRKRQGLL